MINRRTIRLIVFMVNPFTSMIIALREYTLPYAKNMFWAFCAFYGLTFVTGKESTSSDIIRYALELKHLYIKEQFTIGDIISYYQQSGEVDVFRTIIAYSLSRFTDSSVILTFVYATIFGFFYSRNIWYILNLLKGKISQLEKLTLLGIILTIPIWEINGFRMWTAFHIFIYGLLPLIFENKKSSLFFILASYFVHFSFIIPITFVLAYLILRNRTKLYYIIFVLSIFTSEINIKQINIYIESYIPHKIVERSDAYRNETVIEKVKKQKAKKTANWYVKWSKEGIIWSLYIVISFLFFFRISNIQKKNSLEKLFPLVLVIFTFSNFLRNIPSGGRFIYIAIFLTLVLITIYLNQYKDDITIRRLITILSPTFLLFIIVNIRIGFYFTGLMTIIGNPFVAIFTINESIPLNDLIK